MATQNNAAPAEGKDGYYYKGEEFRKNNDSAKHADWYIKDFVVEGEAREVFEKYSGLSPDKVVEHVGEVVGQSLSNANDCW